MDFISFDFSLNSPGICIWNGELIFIAYPKPPVSKNEINFLDQLNNINGLIIETQSNSDIELDFSNNELSKLLKYKKNAQNLIKLIKPHVQKELIIGFEGLSYGSKIGTNNIIDTAAAAAILKLEILQKLKPKDILTIPPSSIKKHAGKGNFNKFQIYDVFLSDPFGELSQHDFFRFTKEIEIYKKIPKPIDDLVDAYFLNHLIRTLYYEKN